MSHTKAGKKEDKFGKASMTQTWTTKIYKLAKINGPNTWAISELNGDTPKDEIKIWQTYNLKKVSKEDVDKQQEENKTKKPNLVNKKAVRAQRQEEQNISKVEQRKNLTAPTTAKRAGRIGTRGAKKIDYKQLAGL